MRLTPRPLLLVCLLVACGGRTDADRSPAEDASNGTPFTPSDTGRDSRETDVGGVDIALDLGPAEDAVVSVDTAPPPLDIGVDTPPPPDVDVPPPPPPETRCDDGRDNDNNGLTDCDDPACAEVDVCAREICDNGVDDTGDGRADCDDFACVSDDACPWRCPRFDLGTTLGPSVATIRTDRVSNDNLGSCGGANGAEVGLLWTAPQTGVFQFTTEGSAYDTLVYVRAGDCGGDELDCNDDARRREVWSSVTVEVRAGESIVVFVDGYGTSRGTFVLNIERVDV